jgi:hypothetical protein
MVHAGDELEPPAERGGEQAQNGGGDLPGTLGMMAGATVLVAVRVIMTVVVLVVRRHICGTIVRALGRGAGFHFGTVGGMFMAMGRIEGLLHREAASAGEEERIGSPGNDFVSRKKSAENLDVAVVGGAKNDGRFHEGPGQLEVFYEYDARCG